MTKPTVKVEVELNGTWTDITGYVELGSSQIQITRGRANEQGQSEPGVCSFELVNDDGRFTLDNPDSPYAPHWKLWVAVRVSVQGAVRFNGFVRSAPMSWSEDSDSVQFSRVNVTLTDEVGLLSLAPGLGAIADYAISSSTGLAHWWQLDEPSVATQAADSVGNTPLKAASYTTGQFGTDMKFGETGLALFEGSTQFVMNRPYGVYGNFQAVVSTPASSGSIDFVLFYTAPSDALTTGNYGAILSLLSTTANDGIWANLDGDTIVFAGASGPEVSFDIPVATPIMLRINLTAAGSQLSAYWGSGVKFVSARTPWVYSSFPTNWNAVTLIMANANGSYSNLFIASSAFPMFDGSLLETIPDSYLDWAKLVTSRIGITLSELGGDTVQGARNLTFRPAAKGKTPAEVLRALVEGVGGVLAADRASGALTSVPADYSPALASVPLGWLAGGALSWDADSSLYYTDVVSESGSILATRDGWPKASRTLPSIRPSEYQQAMADYLVGAAEALTSARLTGLSIDLWPLPAAASSVTNLATNPSFETTSGTVEVRRNYIPNPVGDGPLASGWSLVNQWFGSGGAGTVTKVTASDGPTVDGYKVPSYRRKTWTTAGGDGALAWQFNNGGRIAATAGQTWTISYWWRKSVTTLGSRNRMRVEFYDANTAGNLVSLVETADKENPGTNWQEQSITFTVPTGATHFAPLHHLYIGAAPQVDLTIDGTAVMAELSPVAGPYFDGSYSPDSDLTPSWTGTANASASVLSGVAVSAVSAVNCKAVLSQKWSKSGTKSLRLIPNTASTDTHIWAAGSSTSLAGQGITFVAGRTYTALATVRLSAPLVGASSLFGRIGFVYNTVAGWTNGVTFWSDGSQSANAAGEYPVSLTFTIPANAVWGGIRIYNGASAGNGDVWWDDLCIVEGDYDGPYFDGNTADPDAVTAWTGTANESTSTRTTPGVNTALGLDIGSRLALTAVPPGIPTNPRSQVQGYTETISAADWKLALNVSPDPQFVIGDDVAGILDGDYVVGPL